MKRIMFAALAATLLAGSTGCGVLDVLLVRPACGPYGGGQMTQEPQFFDEGPVVEGSDCCDGNGGDCDTCCRPFPLLRILSTLNPCNWGCGGSGCQGQGYQDGGCGERGCGLFGGQGLFGCGQRLFWGWGCGERYYGNFWGSGCETCDQHGNWTGPTDSYYPGQSASPTPAKPGPPTIRAEQEPPPVAPIEEDLKPMPIDDPAPDAVEGSQTRNSAPRNFRQVKSNSRPKWKARRSY